MGSRYSKAELRLRFLLEVGPLRAADGALVPEPLRDLTEPLGWSTGLPHHLGRDDDLGLQAP